MTANAHPTPWHCRGTDEVARQLGTDLQSGLSVDEAAARHVQHGPNAIDDARRRGSVAMLLDQFRDFMILILLAAAAISGVIGDAVDTIVILAIVVLNATFGFVQEYRAARAVAALKQFAAPNARVLRGGTVATLPAVDLVPGDIVLLEAGNLVPADLRLIETHRLKTGEAALTGESHPVEKHTRALIDPDAMPGDRRNMVYKGTLVTYGRGRGIVVATGMQTELGAIAKMLTVEQDTQTPLQKRLARFGRVIAIVVVALSAILFAVGVAHGEPVVLMALTAISLAVAAIPEALPAVVTVALALGARKMARDKALIRHLPAVETLGSVTFICSDKTGTLTENRMRVEEIFAANESRREISPALAGAPWTMLLHAVALCNDAHTDADRHVVGDPTEIALYEAARRAGIDVVELAIRAPRIAELPFDSERARMTTIHSSDETIVAYTKGAPEQMLARCRDVLTADGVQPPSPDFIYPAVERMAAGGMRVLAIAYRRWPQLPVDREPDTVERELTFLGLVGLIDPPRPEVADAVRVCRDAGVTPVMITGDHPATARAIAARLGIIDADGVVLTGAELTRLSLAEFEAEVERVRVYARVAPAQKIKIVQALQDKNEFVAMTGDGVNDAPALARADIGVAMGITGTDVAKEAADMILLDDDFSTIVRAVREGRRIFDNIRKFIKFVLTGNLGELVTIVAAPLFGLPIPLLPIHILWVNLVTDGLPGLALAVEPAERGVMHRPPRPPNESIFAHGLWQHVVWAGSLTGALCLIVQAWALDIGSVNSRSMVFTVLTLAQMGHVLAIRSDSESLFRRGSASNQPLAATVLFTFGLQIAILYLPSLNLVFDTAPLTLAELGICLATASVVFVAVEIEKWFVRRGWLYAGPRAAR